MFALAADKLKAWTWHPWTSLPLIHQGPSLGVGSLWALLFTSSKPVGDLVGHLHFTTPGAMPLSVVPNEQCFPSLVLVILKDAGVGSFHFNSFSAKQSCGVSQWSGDLHKNDQDCKFKTPQNCSTNILFLALGAGCIDTFSLWKFSKLVTYAHFSGCPLYSSKNVFKNHLDQMNQNHRFGAWEYSQEYSQNSQVTRFRAFTLSRNKRFKTIVPVLAVVFVGLFHYSFHKCIFLAPGSQFCLVMGSLVQRRRWWHPTPVLLPGKSHGWESLVGCSPWGRKELDTTVGHDWATLLSLFTFMHWRRTWKPTPGESQGRGSLVGCHLWDHTESDMTEVT